MLRFKDLYIAVVSDMANQPAKPGHQLYYEPGPTLTDSLLCPTIPSALCHPNQTGGSTPCCGPLGVAVSDWKPDPGGANAGQNVWMQFDVIGPGTGKHLPLKDYLAQELAKGEINITETQQPQNLQSVEEITKLEQKLNGALQELAARKAELQKKTRAAQ